MVYTISEWWDYNFMRTTMLVFSCPFISTLRIVSELDLLNRDWLKSWVDYTMMSKLKQLPSLKKDRATMEGATRQGVT